MNKQKLKKQEKLIFLFTISRIVVEITMIIGFIIILILVGSKFF